MRIVFLKLAQFFLKLAIDKTLSAALPKIFSQLDADMPLLLCNNAPKEIISYEVSKAIARNMNGMEPKPIIDIVTMLYDPTKASHSEQVK